MLPPELLRERRHRSHKLSRSGRRDRPSLEVLEPRLVLSGTYGLALDLGGTGSTSGTAIAADSSGNVYVAGNFQGTSDFDPSTGTDNLTDTGFQNAYIAKYSSSGALVWAGSIATTAGDSSTVAGITLDSSNNVYLTGSFSGTADFNLGSGTTQLSGGLGAAFVAKYDSSGNLLWAEAMSGTNSGAGGTAITLDSSGNIYITGGFTGTVDFDPGTGVHNLTTVGGNNETFVEKLDPSGNYVWAGAMGGTSGTWSGSIGVDGSGNVYVTGEFFGTSDFDPGTGTYNLTAVDNSLEIYVAKLNSSGNFAWAEGIQNTGYTDNDYAYSMAVDASGNVLLTGSFEDTVDFDPGAGQQILSSFGSDDIFLLKLDTSGKFQWVRQYGSTTTDAAQGLTLDASGNIYMTGDYTGTVNFDPGGSANLTSAGTLDIFVMKLDKSGAFDWVSGMGGTNYDLGVAVAVDPAGDVYSTGRFYGTSDFDPGTATHNLVAHGGSSYTDAYVSKLLQPADTAPVATNDAYVVEKGQTLTVGSVTPNLVLRYGFDDATGGKAAATDSGAAPASGGVFSGNATRTLNTPGGASIGALDLTGGGAANNDVATAIDADKVDALPQMTVSAWINLQSAPTDADWIVGDRPIGIQAGGGWDLRISKPWDNSNPLSASNFALTFEVVNNYGWGGSTQAATSVSVAANQKWLFVAHLVQQHNRNLDLLYRRCGNAGGAARAAGRILAVAPGQ